MNFFGLGPLEILLIVVLALIVFGPEKLPQIMAQVGRAIAEFRRTTGELSDEFNRTIQAELAETRGVLDETKSAMTGMQSAVSGMQTSISSALSTATAPVLTTPAPSPAVTTTASITNGTNGAHTDAAPLADNSKWSWESSAPAPSAPPVNVAPAADIPAAKPRRPTRSDDLLPPY